MELLGLLTNTRKPQQLSKYLFPTCNQFIVISHFSHSIAAGNIPTMTVMMIEEKEMEISLSSEVKVVHSLHEKPKKVSPRETCLSFNISEFNITMCAITQAYVQKLMDFVKF